MIVLYKETTDEPEYNAFSFPNKFQFIDTNYTSIDRYINAINDIYDNTNLSEIEAYYYNNDSALLILKNNTSRRVKGKFKWLCVLTCYNLRFNSITIKYFRKLSDIGTLAALVYEKCSLSQTFPTLSPFQLEWHTTVEKSP